MNTHVAVALLIAPLLAIAAWFAVGTLDPPTPLPAVAGQAYPLAAQSNCRTAGGQCDLENADVVLSLSATQTATGTALQLHSSHPLQSAHMAVVVNGDETPRELSRQNREARLWLYPVDKVPPPGSRIRLVAQLNDSQYFAEHETAFLQPVNTH